MLFDNSDANICCRCYGKEEREGRKIGGKNTEGREREKKKMWNRMILSRIRATGNRYRRSRGRPPPPLRRALCQRFCALQWKFPSTLLFTPFFQLCLSISQSLYRIFLESFSFRSSPYVSHCLLAILCRCGINVEILCRPRNKQFITKASDIIRYCRKIQTGLGKIDQDLHWIFMDQLENGIR